MTVDHGVEERDHLLALPAVPRTFPSWVEMSSTTACLPIGVAMAMFQVPSKIMRSLLLRGHTAMASGPCARHTVGEVGFGVATALREHFQRLVTTSPQAYRRAFRGPSQESPKRAGSAGR